MCVRLTNLDLANSSSETLEGVNLELADLYVADSNVVGFEFGSMGSTCRQHRFSELRIALLLVANLILVHLYIARITCSNT